MKYFFSQLGIGVLSGIISGIIVTYFIDRAIKKILPTISLLKALRNEIFAGLLILVVLVVYMWSVERKILPKPILGESYVVIESSSGKEVEVLPDGTKKYTGRTVEVPEIKFPEKVE